MQNEKPNEGWKVYNEDLEEELEIQPVLNDLEDIEKTTNSKNNTYGKNETENPFPLQEEKEEVLYSVGFQEHIKQNLSIINQVIENDESAIIINKDIGNIYIDKGNIGKSGNGLQHIFEQRFEKDNKTIDQIVALSALVLDSAENGKITRDTKVIMNEKDIGTYDLEKNRIIAFVSKTRDGNDEKFIITGFDDFTKKEEAGAAIEAVIANNSYDPEFVIVKNQVVATLASSYNLHRNEINSNNKKLQTIQNENEKKIIVKKNERLKDLILKYENNQEVQLISSNISEEKNKQIDFSRENSFLKERIQEQEKLIKKQDELLNGHCSFIINGQKRDVSNGLLNAFPEAVKRIHEANQKIQDLSQNKSINKKLNNSNGIEM